MKSSLPARLGLGRGNLLEALSRLSGTNKTRWRGTFTIPGSTFECECIRPSSAISTLVPTSRGQRVSENGVYSMSLVVCSAAIPGEQADIFHSPPSHLGVPFDEEGGLELVSVLYTSKSQDLLYDPQVFET